MKTETKNPYVEVTWGSRHQVGNFYVNMFSPHVEYILLGRSLKPTDWPPHHFFSSLHLSSHPCHIRAIEDATFRVANFYVSYPFQSLVVKKWRHSQLYLEKIKISTLINKCPGFPGNSWQKELAKKKRAQIQRTQICSLPPPIATNMEVNLRIVTLVNVEEFVFFALR